MGIEIVRIPSETPNITNVDDIIPMRYAYGNQDGYIIGRGTELAGTYENGTFTVGAGLVVIQGVEIKINANGANTTLDTGTGNRYYHIYLQVNLNSNVVGLVNYYSDSSYDDIQEPYTDNPNLIDNGTAYLLLYSIKLNGSVEVEKNKIVQPIYYNSRKLLWTGTAEIGTTNPENELIAFAKILDKENTLYEVQGEINYNIPMGYQKETFVILLQVGSHNDYGYKAEQIIHFDIHDNNMLVKKVEIHRHNDYFFGRALQPVLELSNNQIRYDSISAIVTKIYEIN